MLKEIKIGTKITILLLTVVILSVFAISYLSYEQSKDSVAKRYSENFAALTTLKAQQIGKAFKEMNSDLDFMARLPQLSENIYQLSDASAEAKDSLEGAFIENAYQPIELVKKMRNYKDFVFCDESGKVIFTSNDNNEWGQKGQDIHGFEYIQNNLKDSVFFSDPFFTDGSIHLQAVNNIFDGSGYLAGYVIVLYDLEKNIFPLVNDHTGLGETGEIILCKLSGIKVDYISPLRHKKVAPLTYSVLLKDKHSVAVQKAVLGTPSDFINDIDYRSEPTLSYWKFIPEINWGIVIKMDQVELLAASNNLIATFLKSGGIITLFSILVAVIFSKLLTNPILSLRQKLNLVAKGILPENVDKSSNDEIGQMAYAVNDLVTALKRTAEFAYQIGKGNHNANFKPMSDDDMLGNALITMSDSIQESEQKDNERNWIVSGVAEIGQILRSNNNLEDLGDEITGFISDKINAIQGAFYTTYGENEDGTRPGLQMKASYAYQKKKYLKGDYKFAEGLVGQCAAEQDIIMRTEIPEEYVTVTSGLLGDQKPTCLLFVPLMTNEKVFGVLEFAGFERFTDTHISFVKEISVIIARTIFNIKVNERTVKLLQESQKMSEELKLQQEILRQNAEEMEATQEELKRTNHRLEDQILEVNRTQKKLQVLLENASEVITIYEKDGRVRYISPSVEPILGYAQEELIGINDISNVHIDSVDTFRSMFDDLLENPEERVTKQFEYKQKDGQTVWLEATGTNLLQDTAIQGIVINSRNITERRRAEKEERMRSQMQALSENSPDLIKRVNNEGVFFYINPVIEVLTGHSPSLFLNKSIHDIQINNSIKGTWFDIFTEVSLKCQKVSTEMDFPTSDGETRIMQVNAIPEMGEDNTLESVLLVSHDITERKRSENEIHLKNKKITESINYAKRIQSSILPNEQAIKSIFKESFIFYKPRDVVSGDFPWFMQQGDDLYIAAVDCTGHGVPGALISLIGYFILNDIVSGHQEEGLTTGEVLDKLNEGVTRTLRQDTEAKTRDGMDIALARINLKQGFFEYSGAHRPLFRFTNNELVETRGNRFPIGGGNYKTRTSFTTHRFDIIKGDEIFLFSDGLPDQFGGAENKKFGNQRIRNIITSREYSNMTEMRIYLDEKFTEWKSDKKQTDDILMIGLKF